MTNERKWEKLGIVLASKTRRGILRVLLEHEKTPKEIATETGFYFSHVSATLSEMQKHGLIICLTPSLRRGRLYSLTDIGRWTANEVEKRSM